MGLGNFILTCEKDNKKLRYDLSFYKSYSKRLKEKNEKYKKVIDKLKNIINEMINCGYIVENGESAVNYIATGGKSEFGTRAKVLLDILKEVE